MRSCFVFEHIPSSSPLEAHAIERINEHIIPVAHKPVSLRVVFRREGKNNCVVGHYFGGEGLSLHMEAKKDDFYSATNEMVDKLARQLKRQKEKLSSHHDEKYEHHNLFA